MRRIIENCRQHSSALIPAAALPVWLFLTLTQSAAKVLHERQIIGWLILLLILTTWAAVMQALTFAVPRPAKSSGGSFSGGLWLAMAIAASMCGPMFTADTIFPITAFQLFCLLLGWAVFCMGMALLLGRLLPPAAAAMLTLTFASLLIFLPITAVPLLRLSFIANGGWPLTLLVNSCPVIWLLHVLPPAMHANAYSWFHLRLMYGMTLLGQNVIVPQQVAWSLAAAISAVVGLAGIVLSRLGRGGGRF